MAFRFPGGDARTTVLGKTGSGKTTCGLWMLAHQRFDKRPWIVFDFKREQTFDLVGFPPIQQIALTAKVPRKPGLYHVSPRPGQEDYLEAFLWRVWSAQNVGLYVDEAYMMPMGEAWPSILIQGRSMRIPVIACSQRPVNVARELFSEASFFCVYRMLDRRDYRTIEGFVPADIGTPLPKHAWHWYDVENDELLALKPVPAPDKVADQLRGAIPYKPTGWHPFGMTSKPTGRLRIVA